MQPKTIQLLLRMFSLILFLSSPIIAAAQDFTKLDDWVENNAPDMGGRVLLMIYKDGKILYSHSANHMRAGQKFMAKAVAKRQGKEVDLEEYAPTTRVPIASSSKWLSAALVMTFVDEGKLSLNDTVGRYLPSLTEHGKGGISIAECLSHTTGIKAPSFKEGMSEMRSAASMDDAIADIAALPMEGEPGKVFHYSSIGLQIAAAVIEKISGKNFKTLFTERIAAPLEMHHTDFGNSKVAMAAGGGIGTTEDYMQFLTMILNKGVYKGKRILGEKSIAEMQVNRITPGVKVAYSPSEAGDAGYGLGEWVWETSSTSNLTKTVTSPGLFGSFPWVDNEKKYCAFLMTFYLKQQGRKERYKELKTLVDSAIK